MHLFGGMPCWTSTWIWNPDSPLLLFPFPLLPCSTIVERIAAPKRHTALNISVIHSRNSILWGNRFQAPPPLSRCVKPQIVSGSIKVSKRGWKGERGKQLSVWAFQCMDAHWELGCSGNSCRQLKPKILVLQIWGPYCIVLTGWYHYNHWAASYRCRIHPSVSYVEFCARELQCSLLNYSREF